MSRGPIDTIAEAFSRTAEKYDSFAEDHPHLRRMRNKVYVQVETGSYKCKFYSRIPCLLQILHHSR